MPAAARLNFAFVLETPIQFQGVGNGTKACLSGDKSERVAAFARTPNAS